MTGDGQLLNALGFAGVGHREAHPTDPKRYLNLWRDSET
jgi:hypothetical protein